MFRFNPLLLVGSAGVPKVKKSPKMKVRRHSGAKFQHMNLRLYPWYYCPLCAEPKQQGQFCRREDCRQLKP